MQDSDHDMLVPDAEEPTAEMPEQDAVQPEEPTVEMPQQEPTDPEVAEPESGAPESGAESAEEPGDAEPAEKQPAVATPDAALVEGAGAGLSWIPFAAYLGLWVVLAGLSAYFLSGATPEQPARWLPQYVPLLWSGVGLTLLGPMLSFAVWLIARSGREKAERRGLFASAMTRGALVTFFGFALWVGTLYVLDLISSGRAL